MRLKNRRVWNMQIDTNPLTLQKNVTVNAGENRFFSCNLKSFFQNVATWKIAVTSLKRRTKFVNILNNIEVLSKRDGQLIDFLTMAKNIIDIKDEVVNITNGSYLLELDEFIPLKNGKIVNKKIKTYKGFQIRFNANGVYGFSICKGNLVLEDNIWSIAICEDAINEMRK